MQGWCFPNDPAVQFSTLCCATCPQALLEFEGLWHQAWLRGIDNAKAQLQATLLVQDPASGAQCGRELRAGFGAADGRAAMGTAVADAAANVPCSHTGVATSHSLPSPPCPRRRAGGQL